MVSSASRRDSSWPVPMVKVRVSMMMSPTSTPHCEVRYSISRTAISTFFSAVRAWPSSSMVSATTPAPCSRTAGISRAIRDPGPSPSSKFTELITARPPSISSPAMITSTSVESSTTGSVEAVANRNASSFMSATPSRPT